MSRSRKHLPIGGISSAPSEKDDKRIWNRQFRNRTRRALEATVDFDGVALPVKIERETELWKGAKDGKKWYANWPGILRK